MPKRNLPTVHVRQPSVEVRHTLSAKALQNWNPGLQAAASDNSISIYEPIGADSWTGEGFTAKRMAGILRSMDGKDVTVNVNSPGGDMFEGLAIYNLLREYSGEVTVKVMGLAASAASVVAMAADNLQIARSGFLMIHNAWILAAGNRHDFQAYSEFLAPFDKAMAELYSVRSGVGVDEVASLMDNETWINGSDAVEQGFADALLPSDQVIETEATQARAEARLDLILAQSGMPRSERRKLVREIKSGVTPGGGTPGATETDTLRAVDLTQTFAALESLQNVLKGVPHA